MPRTALVTSGASGLGAASAFGGLAACRSAGFQLSLTRVSASVVRAVCRGPL